MPPKKKTAAAEGGEAEGGAFRWTLENANKLLILTQGRYLTSEDYERLVNVFPGTNLNGVKIKVSRFRVEQRKLFDEYGWTMPDGGAVLKKPATPRKPSVSKNKAAGADADADGDVQGEDGEAEEKTPVKKKLAMPRKKRAADADAGDEGEEGTPKAKKARGRKPKAKKGEVVEETIGDENVDEDVEDDVEVEEPYVPMAKRVKEEPVEEMV